MNLYNINCIGIKIRISIKNNIKVQTNKKHMNDIKEKYLTNKSLRSEYGYVHITPSLTSIRGRCHINNSTCRSMSIHKEYSSNLNLTKNYLILFKLFPIKQFFIK